MAVWTSHRTFAAFAAQPFWLFLQVEAAETGDVEHAADILWTLTAPDVTDRLVYRRGWGWDRFERWLGDAMADALLGPGGDPDQSSSSTASISASLACGNPGPLE